MLLYSFFRPHRLVNNDDETIVGNLVLDETVHHIYFPLFILITKSNAYSGLKPSFYRILAKGTPPNTPLGIVVPPTILVNESNRLAIKGS